MQKNYLSKISNMMLIQSLLDLEMYPELEKLWEKPEEF